MPDASLTIDGVEVLKKTSGEINLTNTNFVPNSSFMFRNKIINGGMKISQRGTSFAFAHDGTTSGHTLDRFQFNTSNIGGSDQFDCTVSQYSMSAAELNTTGHSKALKLLTGTAESAIENNEQAFFSYKIEAQDVQDFQYGTASAKTITLSFWVKSSVTGTYAVNLYKDDTVSRVINRNYTINTANIWEQKTITIVGDTDSTGSIVNDNGEGLRIMWVLASGSDFNSSSSANWTNYANGIFLGGHAQNGVITTASADWYLTGVQLEEGTVATPFEHRPIGMELGLCQRYFYSQDNSALPDQVYAISPYAPPSYADGSLPNSTAWLSHSFPVTMRAAPTVIAATASNGSINRKTATTNHIVFQWASTSADTVYYVTNFTVSAEL